MYKFLETYKYTPIYHFVLPIFQIYEFVGWKLSGEKLSTPHLIKQKLIRSYARMRSLDTFVETGTYLGVMVNALKRDFKKIYTVEIDNKLYKLTRSKFRKYKHIKALKGDSAKVLPKILKEINSPALFWLDAHWSGGITSKGQTETPIMKELKKILAHRLKNHIILIDDTHLFNGKNGYPSKKEVLRLVSRSWKECKFKVVNNVLIFCI